jgi:hypothetical protein
MIALTILAFLTACNTHICARTPISTNQTQNQQFIEQLTPVLGAPHANQTCTFLDPLLSHNNTDSVDSVRTIRGCSIC